jgi:uncharacterized membrane protein (DUF4010 family)
MHFWDSHIAGLIVAVAVGLLIGVDRERHKHVEPGPMTAGVRTFTLTSLLGAIAALTQSDLLLGVVGIGVVVLIALAYLRGQAAHPGQTTEFALLATFAIGFLAITQVELAAGLGVLIALLLNSKSRLHKFALSQLSEQELHDATLLAGAALIVLPLLPNRAVDPMGVVNLQVIWRLTVLMLSVNALGYVARRTLGAEMGLAVAGFCSGFVSSIMTIAAFGRQAKTDPSVLRSAVAGGAFSSIATAIQLLIIISMTNMNLMPLLGPPIAAMGVVSAVYGFVFVIAARRAASHAEPVAGRAFEPKLAIVFAIAFALMSLIAALLQRWMGPSGAQAAVALGGFVDTHAATASAGRLAAAGALDIHQAAFAAMLAISANTVVKIAVAIIAGGRAFAWRLAPSHIGMLALLWFGWYLVAAGLLPAHW